MMVSTTMKIFFSVETHDYVSPICNLPKRDIIFDVFTKPKRDT